MSNRRQFLRQIAAATGTLSLAALSEKAFAVELQEAFDRTSSMSPKEVAMDEDFWATIKMAYTASPNLINLNNGGVSPAPIVVQDAVKRYNDLSNEAPSYYMWRVLDKGREGLRKKLAALAGCEPE
ncbi:MAG TPA: aminotransferase, partial [Bacteroidetes bacterium]|nr:aminotransferase [Bacteroidota bacterium]